MNCMFQPARASFINVLAEFLFHCIMVPFPDSLITSFSPSVLNPSGYG